MKKVIKKTKLAKNMRGICGGTAEDMRAHGVYSVATLPLKEEVGYKLTKKGEKVYKELTKRKRNCAKTPKTSKD
jgi:hypothetical protein